MLRISKILFHDLFRYLSNTSAKLTGINITKGASTLLTVSGYRSQFDGRSKTFNNDVKSMKNILELSDYEKNGSGTI
jgi:hypothetical protein